LNCSAPEYLYVHIFDCHRDPDDNLTKPYEKDLTGQIPVSANGTALLPAEPLNISHPGSGVGDDYFLLLKNIGSEPVKWLARNTSVVGSHSRIYTEGGDYNWTNWEHCASLGGDFDFAAKFIADPEEQIPVSDKVEMQIGEKLIRPYSDLGGHKWRVNDTERTFTASMRGASADGEGDVTVSVYYQDPSQPLQFDAEYALVGEPGGSAEAEPLGGSMYRARVDGDAVWNISVPELNFEERQNGVLLTGEPDWNVTEVRASGGALDFVQAPAGRSLALELAEGYPPDSALNISAVDSPRLAGLSDERGTRQQGALQLKVEKTSRLGWFEYESVWQPTERFSEGNLTLSIYNSTSGALLHKSLPEGAGGGDSNSVTLDGFDFQENGTYIAVVLFENGTSADAASLELDYTGEEDPLPENWGDYVRIWPEFRDLHGPVDLTLRNATTGELAYSGNATHRAFEPGPYDVNISWAGGSVTRGGMEIAANETIYPISGYERQIEVRDLQGGPADVRVLVSGPGGSPVANGTTGGDGALEWGIDGVFLGSDFEVRLERLNGSALPFRIYWLRSEFELSDDFSVSAQEAAGNGDPADLNYTAELEGDYTGEDPPDGGSGGDFDPMTWLLNNAVLGTVGALSLVGALSAIVAVVAVRGYLKSPTWRGRKFYKEYHSTDDLLDRLTLGDSEDR
jgi:hypothetical protein